MKGRAYGDKKKLLILGLNNGSIGIVNCAKEWGNYTIVTDYNDCIYSNAKLYCDECWGISTADTDLLAIKCHEEQVDAITCGVREYNRE